jgi:uncharacterized protein (TIGR03435 family)
VIVMMKARVLSAVRIVALAGSVAGVLAAQTPASPAFEVASVKRNKSGQPFSASSIPPGGRFTVTNLTLRQLILMANQIERFQLSDEPAWLDSERFDIVAKAPAELSAALAAPPPANGPTLIQLMLRQLLADRFRLVTHNETRELPIYALVLARSDQRLGPQLHSSTTDCAAPAATRRGDPPQAPGERPSCGVRGGPGQFLAGGVSMAQLASYFLSGLVQRPVIDRTGLTGTFDIALTWTPNEMPQGTPLSGAPPLPPIDPNGPSIFTAVQEQLGLKLESTKGPVDLLVIDHVEHPSED